MKYTERFFKWLATKFGYGQLFSAEIIMNHSEVKVVQLSSVIQVWKGCDQKYKYIRENLVNMMVPEISKFLVVDKRDSDDYRAWQYKATLLVGIIERRADEKTE